MKTKKTMLMSLIMLFLLTSCTLDSGNETKSNESDAIQTIAERIQSIKLVCSDLCNSTLEKVPFIEQTFEDKSEIKVFEDAISRLSKDTREVEYALLFQMYVIYNDGSQEEFQLNISDDAAVKTGVLLTSNGEGYIIHEEDTKKLSSLIY